MSSLRPEVDDVACKEAVGTSGMPMPSGSPVAAALPGSASSVRKSQVFQRRLKEKISESRALELLDRKIRGADMAVGAREADGERPINSNQDQEDELVCDSTMVRFEVLLEPEHTDERVCGVLKTVRGIHKQRARDQQTRPSDGENQRS